MNCHTSFVTNLVYYYMKRKKKFFKYITGVQEMRDLLGFTQTEFAEILMLSRAQVAMAELNLRSLPEVANEQFKKLVVAMHSITEEPEPTYVVSEEIDKATRFKSLNNKWKGNDKSLCLLQVKLKKIETDRDRLQKLRKGIKYFTGSNHPPEIHLVARMKEECTILETTVSENVKVKLEKRLFMLETEKAYLDRQLAAIGEKGSL